MYRHLQDDIRICAAGLCLCRLKDEPSLDDILADTATRQIMARDGVCEDHVRRLIAQVRVRLR